MLRKTKTSWLIPMLLSGLLAVPALHADEDERSGYYGMGPGMMGGYGMMGPGMMGRGYGQGRGYDDDWRGPYGPGVMGGYGMGMMGPGMMGGYGMGMMGPGMMGGYGMGMMGHGMMGGLWGLDLSDKQRQRFRELMSEQHNQHWAQMTAMFEQYGKLRQLYSSDKPDAEAIGKVYDEIFKQRRAMIVSAIKMQNRMRDELTDEQRQRLDAMRWGPWR